MKKNIRFLVTERCNQSCYVCNNREGRKDLNRELLKVSDYVNLYLVHKVITGHNGVTIAGGEPLIFGKIDELVSSLYAKGAEITLVVNGSYIENHYTLFKYVKRVYITIHTLDESSYGKIVGTSTMFKQIKKNIENLRALYCDLEINLNVTNCHENKLNVRDLREILEFSEQVKANVQITGTNESEKWKSITLEELTLNLTELGYTPVRMKGKLIVFAKQQHLIYFKQCIFPVDRIGDLSIKYCSASDEIVVHDDARFSVGNFQKSYVDFYEDLKKEDYKSIMQKMKSISEDASKDSCVYCLKQFTKK